MNAITNPPYIRYLTTFTYNTEALTCAIMLALSTDLTLAKWVRLFLPHSFLVDARFGRKDEKPFLFNEVIRNSKHMQMKEQVLNVTSKRKKTCKYVVPSS